jgi:hypothetical protein
MSNKVETYVIGMRLVAIQQRSLLQEKHQGMPGRPQGHQ